MVELTGTDTPTSGGGEGRGGNGRGRPTRREKGRYAVGRVPLLPSPRQNLTQPVSTHLPTHTSRLLALSLPPSAPASMHTQNVVRRPIVEIRRGSVGKTGNNGSISPQVKERRFTWVRESCQGYHCKKTSGPWSQHLRLSAFRDGCTRIMDTSSSSSISDGFKFVDLIGTRQIRLCNTREIFDKREKKNDR